CYSAGHPRTCPAGTAPAPPRSGRWRRSSASASANAFDHPCRSAVRWIRTRLAWNASLDEATAWGVRRTSATLRGSPLPAGREGTFPPDRRPEPARPGTSTAAAEAAHAVLALLVWRGRCRLSTVRWLL